MSNNITCPNCSHQFEPTEALAQKIRDEIRTSYEKQFATKQKELEQANLAKQQMLDQAEQKLRDASNDIRVQREQFAQQRLQQEELINKRLAEERKKVEEQVAAQLRNQLSQQYQQEMLVLQDEIKTKNARLHEAREKEMEFLKRMNELQQKEQELELQVQRQLLEERNKLTEQIRREELERNKLRDTEHQMKLKEKDKMLEDQQKMITEMQRKIEQGSMQLQGEVQELELEQLLRQAFPFDMINEVGKGVRGADCVLTVRNSYGQECGKIIFESKRTKDFSEEWIEKLKADSRTLNADIPVIVTQAMPKGMDCFGERNGVWICDFSDVRALTTVLRDLVIKVYNAAKSQENRGDKMTLLYNYLVSREFAEQWSAIREGFLQMKMGIQRERDQMEKLWKAREKQLEKVLLNAAHIRGSIEGISGMEVDLQLLEGDGALRLE